LRKLCTIPGCNKPINGRGLCPKHYYRWRVNGDPLKAQFPIGDEHPPTCSVEGCDRPYCAKGLCRQHYELQPERKRTKRIVSGKLRSTPRGQARHAAWNAVLRALAKGELKPQPCEKCGVTPTHAHHDSYLPEDRLKVRWLCEPHHLEWHRHNKALYPLPPRPVTITPDSPIEFLGLPARGYNALIRAGAGTLGQLLALRSHLTHVKGIGEKTAGEVEQILASLPAA
jgi:hypothetical protein